MICWFHVNKPLFLDIVKPKIVLYQADKCKIKEKNDKSVTILEKGVSTNSIRTYEIHCNSNSENSHFYFYTFYAVAAPFLPIKNKQVAHNKFNCSSKISKHFSW